MPLLHSSCCSTSFLPLESSVGHYDFIAKPRKIVIRLLPQKSRSNAGPHIRVIMKIPLVIVTLAQCWTILALFRPTHCEGFTPSLSSLTSRKGQRGISNDIPKTIPIIKAETQDASPLPSPTINDGGVVLTKVAVAGATGRTGRYVVEELLKRNIDVVAMVRSTDRAEEVFANMTTADKSKVNVQRCDLTDDRAIAAALEGCDATIWCATGFSDAETGLVERIKRLLGIALAPKQSIDAVGIPLVAKTMLNLDGMSGVPRQATPKVVMLSSAGVTRPSWDASKKERLVGCADIPIVRLNPFGILDVKAGSEQKLREAGVNYCIVRPCGLNDNWPEGARPVFSQGDVAVGRINRKDVAKILVDVLTLPEACDKTFEVIGLAGYPAPREIGPALGKLKADSEGPLPEVEVDAMYRVMQQLLPGERQDAAALAMGQTYEQLDRGETGRLGERGTENAELAAPKPTNV